MKTMVSTPTATTTGDATQRIDVRPIAQTDVDAAIAGWHATNRQTYTYVLAHQQHTLDDARRFFVDHVLTECEVWVVAAATAGAEALCGVIALQDGWIRQLAVFDGWKRRGIGSRLVDLAKTRSPGGLQLHTFERNTPARLFYVRHGFVAIAFGVSPAPESEPDVLYRWMPTRM